MKILFVLECANRPTNGTTATCNRFAHELRKKGHEVRTIGCVAKEGDIEPHYYVGVPHFPFPIFEGLIQKEGFNFVSCHPKYLVDSIKWADIVHVLLPMKFGNVARLLAEAYNKPVTTAFHLQPQNITSAIHMGHLYFINHLLYVAFRRYIYRAVRRVHCPSEMIAKQLELHHYDRNYCDVISNGVVKFFYRVDAEKPDEYKDKFVITMSGRLASEKRQDLIIKAIAHSKYNDQIQLILCGQGPNEKRYRRLEKKLKISNKIQIKFCGAEELRNILSYTDLYVHASDFEIEGISCLEAIACGAVPLISNSKLSAANHFALTPESIFKHGSWRSLKEHIEWMYEHEDERKRLSPKYQELGKEYALAKMVDKMEEFLLGSIRDKEEDIDLPTVCPSLKDHRRKKKLFKMLVKSGAITQEEADQVLKRR